MRESTEEVKIIYIYIYISVVLFPHGNRYFSWDATFVDNFTETHIEISAVMPEYAVNEAEEDSSWPIQIRSSGVEKDTHK